jgi:lincosamide nucleotidyltransferase A/C/D/E
MSAARVREIHRLLAAEGVRCWVVGGWGVDALLGRQTREHEDLDVLLVRSEHPRAWDLLHGAGFSLDHLWEENQDDLGGPEGAALPTAYVLVDADGGQVDVHVLDDDLSPLWVTDRPLEDGALDASGTIDDLTVACMSASMQRVAHTGYELPEEQRRDLQALDEVEPPFLTRAGGTPGAPRSGRGSRG